MLPFLSLSLSRRRSRWTSLESGGRNLKIMIKSKSSRIFNNRKTGQFHKLFISFTFHSHSCLISATGEVERAGTNLFSYDNAIHYINDKKVLWGNDKGDLGAQGKKWIINRLMIIANPIAIHFKVGNVALNILPVINDSFYYLAKCWRMNL